MNHPSNRAERRHQRDRIIARRRFVYNHIWHAGAYMSQKLTNPLHDFYVPGRPAWGRYAKWNMNCGSPMCHAEKYFGPKRKRRVALKQAARDWKKNYWSEIKSQPS